ncbi:MAG: zinc-binding dehydrogenase [Spirochaetia bacterium]|jgi:L-iditol 2-dehydrogenase
MKDEKSGQTMKAAFHVGKHRLEIREIPLPTITDEECLIKTDACAICGSDGRWWASDGSNKIQGHESVGTIVKKGRNVNTVKEGDRVVPYVMTGCGTCAFCAQGYYIYCYQIAGITTGFAEYQVFHPRYLMPVPSGMGNEVATLLGDTLGTPLRAVRKAELRGGETVVVNGLGPLGLIAVQALSFSGAGTIIGVDVLESRRALAQELGASVTLDATEAHLRDEVFRLTKNLGAHVVINAVNDNEAAAKAFGLLRGGGRLILIAGSCSTYGAQSGIKGQAERQVMGTFYFPRMDYEENVKIVSGGFINLERLVSHAYPLARINEAFEMRFAHADVSLKVVITL